MKGRTLSRQPITRMRHDTRRRTLTVEAIESLTPRMLRIQFRSTELRDFVSVSPDDHIKLFFPSQGAGEAQKRDFTPRSFDTESGQLAIDFALHDAGPAVAWARAARVGDTLMIGGPRGSAVLADDFDWYLLIGDETALPAIGRRVEEGAADVAVITAVVVSDEAEAQHFQTGAAWTPLWAYRSAGGDGAADLLRVLDGLALPEGEGFVWIAAESGVARAVRRYMIENRGHPPKWIKAAGYWRRGAADAHERIED